MWLRSLFALLFFAAPAQALLIGADSPSVVTATPESGFEDFLVPSSTATDTCLATLSATSTSPFASPKFVLTSDPDSKFSIDGDCLDLNAAISGSGSHMFKVCAENYKGNCGPILTGSITVQPDAVCTTVFPFDGDGITGPTIGSPPSISGFTVNNGETVSVSESIVTGNIFANGGMSLTLTNVRVQGAIFVVYTLGQSTPVVRINNIIADELRANVVDGQGNLYWGSAQAFDMIVEDSYFLRPVGNPAAGDHTEALAGFGWPDGVQFNHNSFIQEGPFNGTATATINWHGENTVFDQNYFGWDPSGDPATFYTVYVEGANNVVQNSHMEPALGGAYVYPSSNPQATYIGNYNALTGEGILGNMGTCE